MNPNAANFYHILKKIKQNVELSKKNPTKRVLLGYMVARKYKLGLR
jgi:hypothetical protein